MECITGAKWVNVTVHDIPRRKSEKLKSELIAESNRAERDESNTPNPIILFQLLKKLLVFYTEP